MVITCESNNFKFFKLNRQFTHCLHSVFINFSFIWLYGLLILKKWFPTGLWNKCFFKSSLRPNTPSEKPLVIIVKQKFCSPWTENKNFGSSEVTNEMYRWASYSYLCNTWKVLFLTHLRIAYRAEGDSSQKPPSMFYLHKK